MKPILTKVKLFTITDEEQIDWLTLSVWILLMPNLEILDFSCVNSYYKIQLINHLTKQIEGEQRLQRHFHRIKQLIFFSKSDLFYSSNIKHQLLTNVQKIFLNALVS